MPRRALIQRVLTGLLLADFFVGAMFLRINYSHGIVFGGEWVKFTGIDAYWHIRFVDNLSHHFPFMSSVDPYLLYPGGAQTSIDNPFYDYLLSGIVWVAGAGSPTQSTVDTIAPYLPVILGALTIFPAFVIGRALGGRWAGLFAAGTLVIMPGEFLGRTLLGFTDHHAAESVLSATAVMFLVLALVNTRKEKMTVEHLRHPRASGTAKPLAYGALAGFFLGLYLASWIGSALFVFVIMAFLVLQFVVDHVRGVPTDRLALVGCPAFLVALVVFVVLGNGKNTWLVLLAAMFIPAGMLVLSRLVTAFSARVGAKEGNLGAYLYPVAVTLLGLGAFGIAWGIDRSLVNSLRGDFVIFKWDTGTSVSEMVPWLLKAQAAGGGFAAGAIWDSYGFSLIFAGVSLCLLAYTVIRRWEAEKVLILMWTLVMLLATLAQRRFAYYLAVNIAVLAGYGAWQALRLAGLREGETAPAARPETMNRPGAGNRPDAGKKARGKKAPPKPSFRLRDVQAYPVLACLTIFCFLTVIPHAPVNLDGTGERATSVIQYAAKAAEAYYKPADAWCESLTWMRNNTPEPFKDPDYYYARYDAPIDYSAFPNAYSVMAWWDYGYWIVRIGHRPPAQNPSGAIPGVAAFFLAQDEASGARIMNTYGSRYVVLDYEFLMLKFYGAAEKTGGSISDYFDTFLFTQTNSSGGSTLKQATLYFPAYYRSMSVRLYMFGGQAVTPAAQQCQVISWKYVTMEGVDYKMVTSQQRFDTYEQAQAYLAGKSPEQYTIVGENPFVSPVPLEKLQGFAPVHDSDARVTWSSAGDTIPQVRIFQYTG